MSEPRAAAQHDDEPRPLPDVTTPMTARPGHLWYRREFLSLAAWWGLLAFLGASLAALFRFMFPRVLFERAQVFKAGFPDDYAVGEVRTAYAESNGAWVVRTEEGFFALEAVCPHLGCTPAWYETEQKFKCPCHGSGFTMDGVNFEGPSPTPLRRLRIDIADDGQILVDVGRAFRAERDEWGAPGAFLRL